MTTCSDCQKPWWKTRLHACFAMPQIDLVQEETKNSLLTVLCFPPSHLSSLLDLWRDIGIFCVFSSPVFNFLCFSLLFWCSVVHQADGPSWHHSIEPQSFRHGWWQFRAWDFYMGLGLLLGKNDMPVPSWKATAPYSCHMQGWYAHYAFHSSLCTRLEPLPVKLL